MDAESSPATAADRLLSRCEDLPGAELTFPFGPAPAVFKVGGRIFALFSGTSTSGDAATTTDTATSGDAATSVERESVSLKCEPDYAAALVREHPGITPGYHLNKRHWITVDLTSRLPPGLVEELLIDSYDLIVDQLPRSRRPGGHGPA